MATSSSRQRTNRATGDRAAKSSTNQKSAKASFEVDPEILSEQYNQLREPDLPYGFILNDQSAGIMIPRDQLETAGWTFTEDDLVTVVPASNEVEGILLTEARMLVLLYTPEYLRYKRGEDDSIGAVVGLYSEFQQEHDKKLMDVCCDHALVFLSEQNKPLHQTPIRVRFKNVAYWSFKAARDKYYRQLESAFAKYTRQRYTGKNDRWRSLGVLEVQFEASKEGKGSKKNWCCKTVDITTPTVDNFPQLFLGTPRSKPTIWALQDEVTGFGGSLALPGTATTSTLPEVSGVDRSALKNAAVDDSAMDFDFEEEDAEEIVNVEAIEMEIEDDEFDFEEEEEEN